MTAETSRDMAREEGWLLREKYGGKMTAAAKRDLLRLKKGEHINYVIGWSPFLDCHIDLSAKPLIPRPETEYWTEKAIEMINGSGVAAPNVLDIFCGSGCIGTAVLKHVSKARVDFADIEKKYFAGIHKSLRQSKIDARRARYAHSNVFKNLGKRKYDFVLANPPYIPTTGRAVAKSVLSNDPKRALFAGSDGLIYINKLLRDAKKHLNPGGTMIIEFDPPQRRHISARAKALGWQAEFSKDQYGRWRSVALRALAQK